MVPPSPACSNDSLWGFTAHHRSAHAQYPSVKDGSVSVLLGQSTCAGPPVFRLPLSRSARRAHCGARSFSVELSQRTALGILTPHCPGIPTPQSSGAHFPGIIASWVYSSGQEGAQHPQEPGRPGATRTHLQTSAPRKRTVPGGPAGASTRRAAGAQRRRGTRACSPRGRLARGARLSRGLGDPRSALPPPGPAPSRESRSSAPTACFSISISSSSSFPPSHPRSHNRFRLARVPRKEEREGGKNTGNNFPGRRRRWSPAEGAAPSLPVAAAAARLRGCRGWRLRGCV